MRRAFPYSILIVILTPFDLAQTPQTIVSPTASLKTFNCPGAGPCDLLIPSTYPMVDTSRFFDPQKSGNTDLFALFPTQGGIGRPRFAEDHRGANRYLVSLNPVPISNDTVYNDRTPFVFEVRTSNTASYADNLGAALIRQRISGGGHNYFLPFATQKTNFSTLALNSIVRSSNQGGGTFDSYLNHTAPGDDMVFTVQHSTNGCSEGEDECDKLFRAFVETTTDRWGGILKAAPSAQPNGNYALDATIGPGYNPAQSGEDVFLVDLARLYTSGSVTAVLDSPYPGFARLTGDRAAAWATHFGPSIITTLTAPIDNLPYNAACPSLPIGHIPRIPDPMITDESGNGGLANFCATVASTSGLRDGQPITIAGIHSNIEITRIAHVVDATHLTLNAQMYHDKGELLAAAGAQGYGISLLADDIRPGTLVNYHTQPTTTLHKFLPILGSDREGSLYVYTDAVMGYEISTHAYTATHPNRPAIITGVTMRGTAVGSINVAEEMIDYRATPKGLLGAGQQTLSPPAITFTGTCTIPPAAIAAYTYANNVTGLAITITDPGKCSAPPKATLQTEWPNPYRIAPLAITRKVINPATGSTTDGHLLVGTLNPANWSPGDLVEIPGWIHDHAASSRTFGKYLTGASRNFGIADIAVFNGDWASADTLMGVSNQTDGHHYYATPAQPIGPGTAYEKPPDGFALAGDYRIHFPLYTPPSEAVIDIGCASTGYGTTPYHPCFEGIATPYNLFQLHGVRYNRTLRFDPTPTGKGLLAWSGPFAAQTIQLTPEASPSCTAATRGTFNYIAAPSGRKDIVQICAKDAADTFAWRTLY